MAAPQGVNFNGTNTFLRRGADLTGSADSKLVTGSFWFIPDTAFGYLYSCQNNSASTYFHITFDADGTIRILGRTPGNAITLQVNSSAQSGTAWKHCLFSFDLTDTAKRHLYINDASDLSASTYNNNAIDFTRQDHVIGGRYLLGSGVNLISTDIADFWVDFGTYFDFSVEAERRKFIGANATASIDLGDSGENPTGSSPILYFARATADWHTNKGTGGGLTENGALTDAATNPPDYEVVEPGGDLIAQPAIASGQAKTIHIVSGALASQGATIEGSSLGIITASGSLSGGNAAIEGSGKTLLSAKGQLLAGTAQIVGDAVTVTPIVADVISLLQPMSQEASGSHVAPDPSGNIVSAMRGFQQFAQTDVKDIYADWYVQPDVPGPFLTVKEFNN